MRNAKQDARQERVRREEKAEEKAVPERSEPSPVLNPDEFVAYVRDELIPAGRTFGYEITMTKAPDTMGPTMYYDPDTLEGVVYNVGDDVPRRMLNGDQWREEMQRRAKRSG